MLSLTSASDVPKQQNSCAFWIEYLSETREFMTWEGHESYETHETITYTKKTGQPLVLVFNTFYANTFRPQTATAD